MRTRSAPLRSVQNGEQRSCDVLDMTVRDVLEGLLGNGPSGDEWINIRDEQYPWRQIVEAAERGECEVSRVGRKLMMQRAELTKFLVGRRIVRKADEEPTNDAPKGKYSDVVQRILRRDGLA